MQRLPGLVQWFAFEERAAIEAAIPLLAELGITELRTLFSWADWERPGGQEWFDWFIPALTAVPGLRVLPSLFYTPAQRALKDADGKARTSYPPEDPHAYVAFVEEMLRRYGAHFDWLQVWNEPNWKPYWDWDLDPTGKRFAEMAKGACDAVHAAGKQVVLGGTTPLDYPWFARMDELGLLERCDAVAFHYAPSWDNQHRHWMPLPTEVHALRALLAGLGRTPEIWLDESGISTDTASDHDQPKLEGRQVSFFDEVRQLSVERAYWFCLFDQPEHIQTDDAINTGVPSDPTAYHFGLVTTGGRKKPLYAYWQRLAADARAG